MSRKEALQIGKIIADRMRNLENRARCGTEKKPTSVAPEVRQK